MFGTARGKTCPTSFRSTKANPPVILPIDGYHAAGVDP